MTDAGNQQREIERLRARVRELEADLDPAVVSIAENSPDNIMLLDVDARIQYINRTVPDLTREQVIGRQVYEFVGPEFHEGMKRCFERVLDTREPDRYVTWYQAEDGERSYWESSVGAVVREGKVEGFAVITANVTEQRRDAEERERFFNLSIDMLCVAGFDGYFKRVNRAFEASLGYEASEFFERPFVEFIHPDDVVPTQGAMDRLARGESVIDFENRYRRSDGKYRVFSWRAVSDASRRRVYAVARDITERKSLEEQLRQSQKMDAIGQLAGGVAHDFNNLLLAVQGNIEFATQTQDPEEQGQFLKEAIKATDRAADLTKQLLTFGRRQPMNPTTVQLNDLAKDMMNLLRRLIPESIEIDFIPGHQLATILADRSQVEQVIVNLCVNARDAMPNGGRITIETENVLVNGAYTKTHPWARPGRYVILTVTDTGVGMEKDVQQHLFEPFFTTKEQGRGTGLGLATVYGIVQQHQGLLHVYSEPGKGSSFKVYLPVTERLAARVGNKLEAPVPGGTETVLIAEDEEMVRAVIVRVLVNAGYEVLVAKNGVEAVQLFKQQASKVPLVILDVIMPKLNGPEAAELIRGARPDVRVLFTSGYTDAALAGQDDSELLLQKPFEPDRLLRTIRELLDGPSSSG